VGDLSNDVNDNTLNNAFAKYPSYMKCKVVRDRLSMKVSPGASSVYGNRHGEASLAGTDLHHISLNQARYGFIAFSDPEDYLKAWKEMDGKSNFLASF
jgi:RNA recognition motif-containing protein